MLVTSYLRILIFKKKLKGFQNRSDHCSHAGDFGFFRFSFTLTPRFKGALSSYFAILYRERFLLGARWSKISMLIEFERACGELCFRRVFATQEKWSCLHWTVSPVAELREVNPFHIAVFVITSCMISSRLWPFWATYFYSWKQLLGFSLYACLPLDNDIGP